MSISRHLVRVGTTLTAAGVLAIAGAGIASAHVTAHSPDQLVQGGDAEIVFRSPNESQNNSAMTKLQVNFPQTTPLSNAAVQQVPGWSYQINMVTLAKPVKMANDTVTQAVGSIVWTAQSSGAAVAPDQFQDFSIYTEGLPTNTTDLVFTATQTYADGEVVNWNQPTPANGAEPDNPAPHLTLAAAGTADADSGAVTATAGGTSSTTNVDQTARWLGGVGVVLAALALGFGLGALLRRRPTAPTPPPSTTPSASPEAETTTPEQASA